MRFWLKYLLPLFCSLTLTTFVAQGQSAMSPKELLELMPGAHIMEDVYRYTPASYNGIPIEGAEKEIDHCKIRLIYEAEIVADTLTKVKYKDRMIVLIGDKWYKSYGETAWKANMQRSFTVSSPSWNSFEKEPEYSEVIPFSIYRDLENKKIINKSKVPATSTLFYYEEQQPQFTWSLVDESREITGYTCQRAETEFAGRKWIVWFSPEIPADCGFWKFSGLPGLILQAYDETDEYFFTVKSIETTPEPLINYDVKTKKVTREQFREFEEKAFASPILFSQGPEGSLLIIDKSRGLTGREIFTANNLMYPYNPMELE